MINREDYLVLSAILTRRAVAKLRQAEKCVQKGNHPALIEKIRQDASWSERMAVEFNARATAAGFFCEHCGTVGGHEPDCAAAGAAQYHNGLVEAERETRWHVVEFNDDLPF